MIEEVLVAYTDGGSRGNPGPSASAVYLPAQQESIGKFIGIRTNNEAEYEALIMALEIALRGRYKKLKVFSDSELMVKQVKGQYRVNSEKIKPLYERAMEMVYQIDFEITHVLRCFNKEADLKCNEVLDAQ